MDIGHRLRTLIEEKGITQKELADSLNISTPTLSGYLKNRRKPDAETLIYLASYFNTTTDYIYGMTSSKEPPISPYNAEECRLIHIYRTIPEDKKSLFMETGRMFANFEKNTYRKKHVLYSFVPDKTDFPEKV